jgi:hypothetical protein
VLKSVGALEQFDLYPLCYWLSGRWLVAESRISSEGRASAAEATFV